MNQANFVRLTLLSKKLLSDTITPEELEKVHQLMNEWNKSTELDLLLGSYRYQTKDS